MIKIITIRNIDGDLSITDGSTFTVEGAVYSVKDGVMRIDYAHGDVSIILPSTENSSLVPVEKNMCMVSMTGRRM